MKRYIYICDQCGTDIPEGERYEMRLADPEDVEKNDVFFEGKYEFDLCAKCAGQLLGRITNGRIGPDKAAGAEEKAAASTSEKAKETAAARETEEEIRENTDIVQQAKSKRGRPKKQIQKIDAGKQPEGIDIGKVMALYDANWIPTEIAADMKLTEEEVRDVIEKELKKRGK